MGFKIFLDVSKADLGVLFEKLKRVGNMIFVNGDIYIWLYESKNKKSLSSVVKRSGVTDFFLQEITDDNVSKESGFAYAWCREHLNESATKDFESKHQDDLREMLDNIKRTEGLLQDRLKEIQQTQNKEEDEADGG